METSASYNIPDAIDDVTLHKKRVRKSMCSPEEWARHRKLRKKIASAKWYAKKKQVERHALARLTAKLHRKAVQVWCFTDKLSPQQQIRWRCIAARVFHGWPPRPDTLDERVWCEVMDDIASHEETHWSWPMRRIFRHLCVRAWTSPVDLQRLYGPLGTCYCYLVRLGWHAILWPRCVTLHQSHPEHLSVLLSFLRTSEAQLPDSLDHPIYDRSYSQSGESVDSAEYQYQPSSIDRDPQHWIP